MPTKKTTRPNDTGQTSMQDRQSEGMTFWEHLDVLRGSLIKIAIAAIVCGTVAFIFKDVVFSVILAPKDNSFVIYRLFDKIGSLIMPDDGVGSFDLHLINTGLTGQFVIHLKVALCLGVLLASPYILYVLFHFISPALYDNERRYSSRVLVGSYLMFVAGVAMCYFIVFPLTLRFLGTYQVSTEVPNMITLDSYMSTLITTSLLMGLTFELPVLSWLLAKLHLLRASMMRRFRRHALVVIMIVAAVITPTTDMFTMLVVALPIWMLYEFSIFIVRRCERH